MTLRTLLHTLIIHTLTSPLGFSMLLLQFKYVLSIIQLDILTANGGCVPDIKLIPICLFDKPAVSVS